MAINLKRKVQCPHCGAENKIDFSEECETSYSERGMGTETMYEFDIEAECSSCGEHFQISGYICEYPVNTFNDEDIQVEQL